MVHVTEANVSVIDVDLLIHEYLMKDQGRQAFVYVVSPFISNFEISESLSTFSSNLINISDVDTYVDLLLLLRNYGVPINVLSRSPKDLVRIHLSRDFIENQAKILTLLLNAKCDVRTQTNLHAKATITSRGILSGSFNLTKSGRMINLETGFYFPNIEGMEREEYNDKIIRGHHGSQANVLTTLA